MQAFPEISEEFEIGQITFEIVLSALYYPDNIVKICNTQIVKLLHPRKINSVLVKVDIRIAQVNIVNFIPMYKFHV